MGEGLPFFCQHEIMELGIKPALVQLLRRLYSGGCWVTQDDTALLQPGHPLSPSDTLGLSTGSQAPGSAGNYPVRRRRHGSCESGIFSTGTLVTYNALAKT